MVAGVDELSERVMELVAQYSGRERSVITPETEIVRDLGCTSDEARALIARLSGDLGIDMREFDPDRHFDSSGSLFWPIAVSLVVALPVSVLVVLTLGPAILAWGLVSARAASNGGLFLLVYLACVLVVGFITTVLPALRASSVERIPVTVEMLVEAAALKRWPASYEKGVRS